MNRLIVVRLTLFSLLLPFILTVHLPAQIVGEWETVWSKPPDPTLETPTFIDDFGAGNFMVGTKATIMITWDAGRNWREVYSLPSKTVLYGREIVDGAIAAPGHYLMVCDSIIYVPNGWRYESSLFVTTDGGLEWRTIELPSSSYIFDLKMLNASEGLLSFVTGDSTALYQTSNGGLSWSPRQHPEATWLRELVMTSSSAWGAIGRDTATDTDYFYRTDDAGQTWERSRDSIPYLVDLAIVDDQTIYGVGGRRTGQGNFARDIIQRSTDGGITWHTILDTLNVQPWGLYSVDFADEMNGIAVGGGSRILRTTDGGTNWRTEWGSTDLMLYNETFEDVAYPAVDNALIAGSRYAILGYRGDSVLSAPTIVKPDSNLTNHPLAVTLAWTPVIGATSYEVEIGDTAFDYNIVAPEVFEDPWLDTAGLTDSVLTVQLAPHTRYTVRVRGRGESIEGAWSRPVRIRSEGEGVVLPMPSFVYPRPGNVDIPVDVTIRWSQVQDAIGYDLVLGTDPSYLFNPIHFDNLPDTSHFVAGLKQETLYFAAIRSRNQDGVTSNWREMQFTTTGINSVPNVSRPYAVSVRPNVATEQISLFIPTTWSGIFPVRIFAVDGREVQRELISVSGGSVYQHNLDCSTLPSGQYMVVVDAEGKRFTLPVLVAR